VERVVSENAAYAAEDLWVWTRFYTTSADDWRPAYKVEDGTPGLGPYWCSGYAYEPDRAIICAWVRPGTDVRRYWPEAEDIVHNEPSPLRFSDRFPEPDWWATAPENPAARPEGGAS
jgi:hypothetical protein